jgi:CheY-like chemotaxis protein
MGARILVADDSVTIQKVVELTFGKEDFALTQARSGGEAIQKAKEIRPDLVLLDLVMPDMNGYDVCAALRSDPTLRSVPIIFLAGAFESFDRQRGAQVGANDVVTKPFESQVLIGKVKQLLFARTIEGSRAPEAKPAAEASGPRLAPPAAGPVTVPRPPESVPVVSEPSKLPSADPPQEELWELLGASLAEQGRAESRDDAQTPPSVGEIVFAAPPPEPATAPLDLGALALEPGPVEAGSPADAMDVLPLPESLSLEDLLASEPDLARGADAAVSAVEPSEDEVPVFELSETDAAPLPMTEAGRSASSALPFEELLGQPPSVPRPADAPTLELAELDLAAMPEASQLEPFEMEPALSLGGGIAAAPPEAQIEEMPQAFGAPMTPEAGARSSAPDVGEPFPLAVDGTFPAPPAAAAPASRLPEAPAPAPLGMTPSELAVMRDAVTERVAHELRQALTEKLAERFEKIVWEVVPDLAEMLIAKEIERIRRLAEEEKPS